MNKKTLSIIILGILVLFYLLKDILFPFAAGAVLAYFFDPIACYFEKKFKSRGLAVSLIFLIAILVVLIGLLILFPIIKRQVLLLTDNIPNYVRIFWNRINPLVVKLHELMPESSSNIEESLNEHVTSLSKIVVSSVKKILSGSYALFNFLSLLIITPVVAFYLLCDWNEFCKKISDLIPRKSKDKVIGLYREMDKILSGFIRGQATVCASLALYYSIGLTVTGLDFGILLGMLTGCLSFIPFVGVGLGLVSSVILALVQFNTYGPLIGIAVVFLIGQILEGYVLTPNLVGDKVGLHPVWIMFALLAGGVLFGFFGVVIAVPGAALIGVLVRFATDEYKKSNIYLK
ncbi:MAG: AI-2E family transporter [Alphaproteobacteria bacterium]|nr:AI-2E family transporter [Alphaproteobacteria bacterium]